jgi:hypothetical protein
VLVVVLLFILGGTMDPALGLVLLVLGSAARLDRDSTLFAEVKYAERPWRRHINTGRPIAVGGRE